MSLIFDKFPSRSSAEEFAAHAAKRFGRRTAVYDSQDAMEATYADAILGILREAAETGVHPSTIDKGDGKLTDAFGCALNGPVVLVERPGMGPDTERSYAEDLAVEAAVEPFGGEFAGT